MNKLLFYVTQRNWEIEGSVARSMLPLLAQANSESALFEDSPEESDANFEIIHFENVLVRKSGWCTEGTEEKAKKIAAAEKPIILKFHSGGGEAGASIPVIEAIKNSKFPVYAFVEGICCSAAYKIASACSAIYCETATSMVGSIGTMVTWLDQKEYLEKLGIKEVAIYAPKSTEKNLEIREFEKGNNKPMELFLANFQEDFEKIVRENRPNIVNDVFSGKTYFASQAVELGLVDGILSFNKFLEKMASNPNESPVTASMLEKVLSSFGFQKGESKEISVAESKILESKVLKQESLIIELATKYDSMQQEKKDLLAKFEASQKEMEALKTQQSALKLVVDKIASEPAAQHTTSVANVDVSKLSEDERTLLKAREMYPDLFKPIKF